MKRKNRESSSSSSSRINYEVFLSFRGADTRKGFTDHLYSKLRDAGIQVFRDDEGLCAGEGIKRQLKEAIKRSRISIVVLSKDYASSKSCLQEAVQMWECKESSGQTIIPIFYDISPSDVRHQAGDFGKSFEKHEQDGVDTYSIKTWKEVFRNIGMLCGYHRENVNGGHEAPLIREVLKRVRRLLKRDDQDVTDKLVEIDLHVQEMMTKLGVVYSHGQAVKVCGEDARVVGICGLPGVGKTTLAKVVFNKIHKLFEGCSFLECINSRKVESSQEMLIADLQEGKCASLRSSGEGIRKIASLFNKMKVLIVLDDVREDEQIKALVGKLNWFGSGSRIIVTTNSKNVFNGFNDEAVRRAVKEHKVDPMIHHHALQLFCKHAFQGDAPQYVSEYDSLSIDIVNAIGGLPLAIVLLASKLCNDRDDIRIWRSTLKFLKKNRGDKVKVAFDASYESLDDSAKEIFLDIACFFIGKEETIPFYMWDACDYYPPIGIKQLCDMYLLEIGGNNELRMHNLLRDFGRKLVEDKDPHKRCRFWNHGDAISIPKDGEGTKSVEGIGLTVEDGRDVCFTCEEFREMSKLRYLRLNRANIRGNTGNLPPNLRWLDWRECHSIPELCNMHLNELVILDLSWSPVTNVSKFWEQITKKVEKLKVLKLQGCVQLHASLNFPAPTDLEMLILEDCSLLSQIRPFGNLKNLISLNLRNCSLVKELPQELYGMEFLTELLIDGTGIQNIHCREGSLKNLEILSARNCNSLRDISTIGRLRELSNLDLDGADIEGLPCTFEFPQRLKRLSLRGCQKLFELPTSIGKLKMLEVLDLSLTKITEVPQSVKDLRNLKTLKMAHTHLRKFPKDIGNLENLEEIDFSFCINMEGNVRSNISRLSSLRILRLSSSGVAALPKSIRHLSRLQTLDILKCNQLPALPELPSSLLSLCWGSKKMTVLDLSYLTNLKELYLRDAEQPKAGVLNLETPNIGWITRLPSLEILELSLSNVTNLPRNFSSLTQLRELCLSYMKELDLTQLPLSTSLSTLRLKYCKIPEPKFSSLKFLSELELQNCNLAKIDGLEDLRRLEVLKIFRCSSISNLNELKELPRLGKVKGFSSALASLPELSEGVEVDICD